MNKLILCEGKTDAILLSYYLERMRGWKYTRKSPKGLDIKVNEEIGESANWYQKDDEFLLICAVGSKSGFSRFFNAAILRPLVQSDAFNKIALVIDHDDETIEEIVELVRSELALVAKDAQDGCWVDHEYENGYGERHMISFLLQIIPTEKQGALESLLLEAISEDPYDKNIVDKSKQYVDSISSEADRYIGKRRLVLKAYLGVTWAIQSPQKVFTHIDSMLKMVRWEASAVLYECFKQLLAI